MRSKVLIPIGLFLLILAVLTGIAIIIIQTHYFRQFVKLTTNSIVTTLTAQNFKIGRIDGNFLKGITLSDVTFDIDGEEFIACDEIYIDYSLPLILDGSMLFSKVIPLHEVRVSGLRVNLVHYGDDTWNFNKLDRLIVKEKRPNPDWNVFIANGRIENAKMTIYDVTKDQRNIFELPYADLSVNLIKIADKAEFTVKDALLTAAYQNNNFRKIYFTDINGVAVYSNKEKVDVLDVERASFDFNGASILARGRMKDLQNPTFTLNGKISGVKLEDLGTLNADVKARGESPRWKGLLATGKLELSGSELMGSKLTGSIKKIEVENTRAKLRDGNLAADFGKASFEGELKLSEITKPGEKNSADLKLTLDSLNVRRILEIAGKTGNAKGHAFKDDLDAAVNSRLGVKADWKNETGISAADLDISELTLKGPGPNEIKLSGPVSVTPSKIDFDVDSTFTKTDLSRILKQFAFETDLNAGMKIKGSLVPGEALPGGLRADIKGEAGPSRVSGFNLDRLILDGSYSASALDIRTLKLDSGPIKAEASGALGAADGSGIKYDIDISDLKAVAGFLPGHKVSGRLGLEGYLKGRFDDPRVIIEARGTDFAYDNHKLKAKKIGLSADTSLNLKDLRMKAAGELKGIEIQGRTIQIADFKAESSGPYLLGSVNVQETPKRKYSIEYKASGLGDAEKTIDIARVRMDFKDTVLQNRNPIKVSLLSDRVKVSSFNLYHKENFVLGELDMGYDERVQARLRLEKLSLPDVSELLNIRFPVKGQVSGEVTIGNSLKAPDLRASVMVRDLEYMKFHSDELDLSLLYSHDELGLDLKIRDDGRELLSAAAEAKVPFNPENMNKSLSRAVYRATVRSRGIDISPLAVFNPEIQELSGSLMVDMVATGANGKSDVSGSVELSGVKLDILALRNDIEIEHAVMDMDGTYGTLRPAAITTGQGEGVFQGKIDFRDLSYSGNGVMSDMLVKTYPNDVSANLNGDIDVSGKYLNSIIKGNITVNNLKAIVPEKPLKEIENIKFIDEEESQQDEFIYTGIKKEDFVEEFLALDLNVDIPRQSWVKGNGANIEVEGKLDINKSFKEPYIITGNIDVVRGDYQFMGRLFNIESGTVSFRGKKIIDPFLDLRATYEVASVEVYINVSGTAEKPKIQLSSDPPLDDNEIVSYLVFGTSSDKLGTDERVEFQEKAGEVLGTMAVGELRQAIGDDLSIDVMTIKGGQTGFRDTHFEVGKYLTEDLYVGYERLSYERFFYERYFLSPGLPSSTVTANRAVIEYRVFDFLTLESEIGEEAGADVFFNFDY